MSDEKTVTLKVERNLADAFKRTAKANDRSQSLLIRDFMKAYVRKNGQIKLDFNNDGDLK
jgi:predicted transcriptional regulator